MLLNDYIVDIEKPDGICTFSGRNKCMCSSSHVLCY